MRNGDINAGRVCNSRQNSSISAITKTEAKRVGQFDDDGMSQPRSDEDGTTSQPRSWSSELAARFVVEV